MHARIYHLEAASFQFFELHHYYKTPRGNLLIMGIKYMRSRKNCAFHLKSLFIAKTVRDIRIPMVNMSN